MKKFLLKTSYFSLPFFLLYFFNLSFYSNNEGDLARLAYLYFNPLPKSQIDAPYNLKREYSLLSDINLSNSVKFDVLTIGDSFSEQGDKGYQNFLAQKNLSVLHIDEYISNKAPIQTLVALLNSDFFETIKVDYIVLQSVQRKLNQRTDSLNFESTLSTCELSKKIKQSDTSLKKVVPPLRFFSKNLFTIPITNLSFFNSNKPNDSRAYRFMIKKPSLFEPKVNNVLIYVNDIRFMEVKNDFIKTQNSVRVLNELGLKAAKKNIQLITLVSPDKYDMFYPFLSDNNRLVVPNFSEDFQKIPKEFLNVPSFKALSKAMEDTPNLYYYDDTHWTPVASKIVADEIFNLIKN